MKLLLAALFTLFTISAQAQILTTASYVDVPRFVGKWYALKSLPQFFTRKCLAQTAEYEVINEKKISVLNTCLEKNGSQTIEGQAVVTNPKTNSELEVTFNNFFTRLFRVKGDYNIIKLDAHYEYLLVGSRDRKSLWIMSRTPDMPTEIMDEYIAFARKEGFPVNKLITSKF
jgi:apolipoprotein D and lipocalin family protein